MRLQGSRTFGHRRLACRPALERLEDRTVPSSGWGNFAHDPQHTGLSTVASQPLDRIDWQTPVDQGPVFFSHYGVPVITAENTVIYPVAVNSDNDRARRHGVRHQRGILFAIGGLPKYTLTDTVSLDPAAPGQSVSFTATVRPIKNGPAPTGTIAFEDGSTVLARINLANGQASYTTAFHQLGSRFITALYSGDSTYASGSTELVESICHADFAILATSTNPSILGHSITLNRHRDGVEPDRWRTHGENHLPRWIEEPGKRSTGERASDLVGERSLGWVTCVDNCLRR